jgi:microcystin-dependent protein
MAGDNTYKKNILGVEDQFFDTPGTGTTFNRETSTGGFQTITGLNASHLPLLLATRTLELYDQVQMNAEEVDAAITQICASLASIHKFDNQDILDGIDSFGSGAIITAQERDKLNAITDTGSGAIITDSERSKLNQIVGLTQDQIDAITNIGNILPVGTIIGFPTSSAPTGFLECDGAAIDRVTYSDLFGLIGISYGAGNGTTTFNIPDYRGRFPRGWNHGAGNDPDAASRTDRGDGTTGDNIGTIQGDEIKSHSHDQTLGPLTIGAAFDSGASETNTAPNDVLPTNNFGGNETRPKNINTMWCIRWSLT